MPTLSLANAEMINDFVQNFSNAFVAEHKEAGKRSDAGYKENSSQQIQFDISARPKEDFDSNISEYLNKQFNGQSMAILEGLQDRSGNVVEVANDGKVSIGDKPIGDTVDKRNIVI